MPNWVKNIVKGPREVLVSLVRERKPEERSHATAVIDFGLLLPWNGEPVGNGGISLNAEDHAKARLGLDILKPWSRPCSENEEKQVEAMLRNHAATRHLHEMDFARKAWGTKWNACQQTINLDAAEPTLIFETAWACPEPVLVEMSRRFPEADIRVEFADEDMGYNCGRLVLRDGQLIDRDVAPRNNRTPEDNAKWIAFAEKITGRKHEVED